MIRKQIKEIHIIILPGVDTIFEDIMKNFPKWRNIKPEFRGTMNPEAGQVLRNTYLGKSQ